MSEFVILKDEKNNKLKLVIKYCFDFIPHITFCLHTPLILVHGILTNCLSTQNFMNDKNTE